jgi:hypothetical protein
MAANAAQTNTIFVSMYFMVMVVIYRQQMTRIRCMARLIFFKICAWQ